MFSLEVVTFPLELENITKAQALSKMIFFGKKSFEFSVILNNEFLVCVPSWFFVYASSIKLVQKHDCMT